ncbi:MAG: winged helix-turn-helix domain-containing protein [Pseudomonadota bacterium]
MTFGPFRLDARRRRLTRDGEPVPMGARALDLLVALANRPGEVVTRDELMEEVWPRLTVEDTNLRAQVSLLRRALGDDDDDPYIATVTGRGYSFVAPVTRETPVSTPPPAPFRRPSGPRTAAIGRESLVRSLSSRLRDTRLLTIVGPGGIGKTTLAHALIAAVEDSYADGVVFVDLAEADDPAIALSSALGLALAAREAVDGLTAYLAPHQALLVFDSSEHTVEATAALAARILERAAGVTILATGREALRAEGEVVWRLEPLPAPPADSAIDAAGALAYASVELFVERARAALGLYALADRDAPIVADICRELDGLPLAIELAAARLPGLGVQGISEALHDRLRLLSQGRRTALPRHRTMQAAIDWSYRALAPAEQTTLRRLSLFVGPFSAAGATAVAGGGDLDPADVAYVLADLVSKSLVVAKPGPAAMEYRLLDTTRDYAQDKLRGPERAEAARRHARHTVGILSQAEAELANRSKLDWITYYNRQVANLGAALDWSHGPDGDPALAIEATLAGVQIWARLSRSHESQRRVIQALAVAEPDSRAAMYLKAALGHMLMFEPDSMLALEANWRDAAMLARRHGDVQAEMRAGWGLWNAYAYNGRMREAVEVAHSYAPLVARHGGPFERAVADRLLAASLSLSGDHEGARLAAERALAAPVPTGSDVQIGWYSFDPRATARNTLGTCWWIQGLPGRAAEDSALAAEEALQGGADITVCAILSDNACPIHMLIGDLAAADRYLQLMKERVRHGGLMLYAQWIGMFEAVLAALRGDPRPGLALLTPDLLKMSAHPRYSLPLTTLAAALAEAGATAQARGLADDLLAWIETSGQRWIWPEVQRVRGELSPDSEGGAALIEAAIAEARAQGAPAWGLRAAVSLARRRPTEAEALLRPWLAQFTDGFDTPDILAARALLPPT